MTTESIRKYLNLLLEVDQRYLYDTDDNYQWVPLSEDDNLAERDKTDELDFSPDDSFDDVIKKVMSNEENRIGIGKYRQGWHHPFDKRLVIKIATPRDENSKKECALRNFWEYLVWHKCKSENLPELEHLMPVKDIHPDGLWMTQRKGTRVPKDKKVNIKGDMTWVGDRTKVNFAMLGDEIKSIDYGTKKAIEHLGLPLEYDAAHAAVNKILKAKGVDVNDPNYGKSKPAKDPLNPG